MSATETRLAESAQAIFCSIADYLGASQSEKVLDFKKKYPTFGDFLKSGEGKKLLPIALDRVKVDAKIKDVYDFLIKKNDWYKSSIIIANKLVKDLKEVDSSYKIAQEKYAGGNMFYLRGDAAVMNTIAKLFKAANTSSITKKLVEQLPGFPGFTDINKWSPADIYFANQVAKSELKKQIELANKSPYTFDLLNTTIKDLIDGGNLLPLSLKKTTSTASIVKVNFSEDVKNELLRSISFTGTTDWKEFKRLDKDVRKSFMKIKEGQKTQTRDIRLFLKTKEGEGEIKIRHDPSGSGRLVSEFKLPGGEARGGSIASHTQLHNLFASVDKSSADQFLKAYNKGNIEFRKIKKSYEDMKKELRSNKYKNTTEYDHYLAIASAENITNAIMPIIKKWFASNKNDKAQKLVRLLYQVVTSRSPLSSRFVIAK